MKTQKIDPSDESVQLRRNGQHPVGRQGHHTFNLGGTMNGLNHAANADELALHYERSLVAGDVKHAEHIKFAHADLSARFAAIDERLAQKRN